MDYVGAEIRQGTRDIVASGVGGSLGGKIYKKTLAGGCSYMSPQMLKPVFWHDNSIRSMVKRFCIPWKFSRDLIL